MGNAQSGRHQSAKIRFLLSLLATPELQAELPEGGISQAQLAAFCGCSRQLIGHIEKTALAKMRRADKRKKSTSN